MNVLDSILMALGALTSVTSSLPGLVGVGSAIAAKLVAIAKAAADAHLALTGKPIDLTQLHTIDPVV